MDSTSQTFGVRYDYALGTLEVADPSPFVLLKDWLSEAVAREVPEPGAMCLSTVKQTEFGPVPRSRFVLLRGFDEAGLKFFSNYESAKGREIDENPNACITFWWALLERQIRIEGTIRRLSAQESDDYFHSRPRDSQIASAASPQSQPIESREHLDNLAKALAEEYPDAMPRPEHWGGYILVPSYFEFWQGRPARLHDRIEYRETPDGWQIQRLAP